MRVLIVPMAALTETSGPTYRTAILVDGLLQAGIEVTVCAAKDGNQKHIEGAKYYPLSNPMPMGMPSFIAPYTFPLATRLGITARKEVKSFEEVLFLIGNTNYSYLKKSVNEINNAIEQFRPDFVYSEFNLSAILAAKMKKVRLFTTVSAPTQPEYCKMPQYAKGVNRLLRENGLPGVESCLDLFRWAQCCFVPSCQELEQLPGKVTYIGSLKKACSPIDEKKDTILVYMGNGTISQKKMLKVVTAVFQNTEFEVFIAGRSLANQDKGNIHINHHFNFEEIMPRAALYINHGGQNSITDALLYGVPQIICPGKVFERRYNADSIQRNGAGILLPTLQFTEQGLKESVDLIMKDCTYGAKAKQLGNILKELGGVNAIIHAMKNFIDPDATS